MVWQGEQPVDKGSDLHFLQITPDCRKQEMPAD